MKNLASAGFEDYEYPKWSTAIGWLIFVACIIPIPLFYLVNYIREYRSLAAQDMVELLSSKISSIELFSLFRSILFNQ